MEEALAAHPNVVVVRFNPWLFNSEERLLCGFFETLGAALAHSVPRKADKLAGLLRGYGALLALTSVSAADRTRSTRVRAMAAKGSATPRRAADSRS